jgi:hypothetical protein
MKNPKKIRKHFADKLTKLIQQYPEVVSITYSRLDGVTGERLNRFERLNNEFSLNFYTRNNESKDIRTR